MSVLLLVDQAGYSTSAAKIAVVRNQRATAFTVQRDGAIVLRGTLSPVSLDRDSGDAVRHADFSAIDEAGQYELRVGDTQMPVVVSHDPYRDVQEMAVGAFHAQRCGVTCHLHSQFHASSGRTGAANIKGGWHDAGDYGRYVVNSGISTATLLWAWELFGAGVLDEARWNVEWMLSMQDADGGAWHKLTPAQFPALDTRAEEDESVSLVIGKGSCATANLAAVTAIAGRVYGSQRHLDAAKRAWSWLDQHPSVVFRNPPGIATGEYGDDDCRDERLWAAAELWRSARDESAHQYFLANIDEAIGAISATGPPSWREVGALAAWTYAFTNPTTPIRERSIAAADAIVARAAKHPYRIPLTTADYIWGSNGIAANYALQLLVANELKSDQRYLDTVRDILHYLLGRNTFGLSFVTGAGSRSVTHPHHRPSVTGALQTGLLAGGPNQGRQDEVLKALPAKTPPARMYADDARSFASNEVAINWNAPLVFALAGLREPEYRVIAYVRRRADISRISAEKLTHINWAFGYVNQAGEIYVDDREDAARFAQLHALKAKNPRLKIILSVGGWGADGFSDAALTDESRAKFGESAVALVKRYALDGIDLDWEYPGDPGPGIKFRPEDKGNFTLMLKTMREHLHRHDPRLTLSIADSAGNYFKRTEMDRLHVYLDWINIMTYDFSGSWTKTTGHHSGLYPNDATRAVSVASFVKQHLDAGIPSHKLVVGVPFYGRGWMGVTPVNNGLHQPWEGPVIEYSYARLAADFIDQQGYQRCWDAEAMQPYLWNPDLATFITYDDPVSLREKAEYVRKHRLGGIMYWEHSHDPEERLLDAVKAGLSGAPPTRRPPGRRRSTDP
jgi:GH18 family chitinase